jgi:hypothetical protein
LLIAAGNNCRDSEKREEREGSHQRHTKHHGQRKWVGRIQFADSTSAPSIVPRAFHALGAMPSL